MAEEVAHGPRSQTLVLEPTVGQRANHGLEPGGGEPEPPSAVLVATVARGMGLVDELVPSKHHLRWSARKAVLQGRKSRSPSFFKRVMTFSPIRGYLAGQMRQKTRAKVRETHYPAPFRLIDLFEKHGGSPERMKREETKAFAPLMISDTSRNLRRVFRLTELLKGQAPKKLGWKPSRVHVIGAGTMGADIAGAGPEDAGKILSDRIVWFMKRLGMPNVVAMMRHASASPAGVTRRRDPRSHHA